MDTLVLSFHHAAKSIEPSTWPEIEAKADLRAFFAEAVTGGRIPSELSPKDWSRFVDNVFRLVAANKDRPRPNEIASIIRRDFDAELALIGPDAVPLSISLWQLTFASLFKAGSIRSTLRDHWPLITPELEDLYPKLRDFNPRFDFS